MVAQLSFKFYNAHSYKRFDKTRCPDSYAHGNSPDSCGNYDLTVKRIFVLIFCKPIDSKQTSKDSLKMIDSSLSPHKFGSMFSDVLLLLMTVKWCSWNQLLHMLVVVRRHWYFISMRHLKSDDRL